MRNVSLAGLQSMLAEETASVWLFAIEIHPHDDDPDQYAVARACSNSVDVVFAGHTYLALPFEVTLAADNEDTVPQAKIRVDNVSRAMSESIRKTNYPPTIYLNVLRIAPDGIVTRELGPSKFTLLSATVNAFTMEGILGYESDFLNEPATHHKFTPAIAPALFS